MAEMCGGRADDAFHAAERRKTTELDPLPKGWYTAPLLQLLRPTRVHVRKVKRSEYKAAGRYPVVDQGKALIAGYWDRSEDVYGEKLPVVVFGDHTRVFKYVDFPFAVGADGTRVLEPDTRCCDPYFLYCAALTLKISSRGYNRHFAQLREVYLPLPPLSEQRAIAHILHSVQRAKEATDKVIEATRELKRSLMHYLFTYGPVQVDAAERVPLKETEIGSVPEHWDVVRLGDVGRIGNGSTPKRSNKAYWDGGTIPWLTSAKVHERVIRYADEFVTEVARRECHLPLVRRGSIVIAITGQGKTLGNAALVDFDTCVSQHLAYVQFRSAEIVPEFVLFFLHYHYERLRQASYGGGSTKGALTCGFLASYPLPLPPVPQQLRIAQILDTVEQKLRAEENRRQALEHLFKSLLRNLMTGRMRVTGLPVEEHGPGR